MPSPILIHLINSNVHEHAHELKKKIMLTSYLDIPFHCMALFHQVVLGILRRVLPAEKWFFFWSDFHRHMICCMVAKSSSSPIGMELKEYILGGYSGSGTIGLINVSLLRGLCIRQLLHAI